MQAAYALHASIQDCEPGAAEQAARAAAKACPQVPLMQLDSVERAWALQVFSVPSHCCLQAGSICTPNRLHPGPGRPGTPGRGGTRQPESSGPLNRSSFPSRPCAKAADATATATPARVHATIFLARFFILFSSSVCWFPKLRLLASARHEVVVPVRILARAILEDAVFFRFVAMLGLVAPPWVLLDCMNSMKLRRLLAAKERHWQ
jgi:hypothetical protein